MKKKLFLILAGILLTIGLSAQLAKLDYTRGTNSLNIGGVGAVGVNSTILLNGSTSGTSTLKAAAVAGSTTFTFGTTTGTIATTDDVTNTVAGYIAAAELALAAEDSLLTVLGGYTTKYAQVKGIHSIRSTGTIVDATGITAAMLHRFMYYSEAAATDISNDPQIANGTTGQIITIIGSSDSNTLTLDDGAGLQLSGQCVLGASDSITLLYEGTIGDWIELARVNN